MLLREKLSGGYYEQGKVRPSQREAAKIDCKFFIKEREEAFHSREFFLNILIQLSGRLEQPIREDQGSSFGEEKMNLRRSNGKIALEKSLTWKFQYFSASTRKKSSAGNS